MSEKDKANELRKYYLGLFLISAGTVSSALINKRATILLTLIPALLIAYGFMFIVDPVQDLEFSHVQRKTQMKRLAVILGLIIIVGAAAVLLTRSIRLTALTLILIGTVISAMFQVMQDFPIAAYFAFPAAAWLITTWLDFDFARRGIWFSDHLPYIPADALGLVVQALFFVGAGLVLTRGFFDLTGKASGTGKQEQNYPKNDQYQ